MALVSIIIVNHNGLSWLKNSLRSAISQDFQTCEVILVDNNSKDDSVLFVKNHFPQVKIIVNHENSGFAEGNNIGIRESRGDYIFLVNNDTRFDSHVVSTLIKSFKSFPNAGILQPKILILGKEPPTLDGCGSLFTNYTFLYHVGLFKRDSPEFNQPTRVFCIKGAAMMVKREVFDKIGLFDKSFWCYYEETDFCHRAWVAGYESIYAPACNIWHAGGSTSKHFKSDLILFHNSKNKIRSFIKNFELINVLWVVPTHVILSFGLLFNFIHKTNIVTVKSLTRAIVWNISNFRETMRLRKLTQGSRILNDDQIFQVVKKTPNIWRAFMSK